MPQVTIYLDPETDRRLRTDDSWPTAIAAMAGAWTDVPEVAELSQGFGADVYREPV